jgi:hypothetical protein
MTKSEEQQRRQRRAEMHNVYVARGETISPAFAELRTAQILAEIHFGRPAADAMGVLLRGRHQVFAAVSGLYSGPFADYFPTAEQEEHHRQFEVSMHALIAEHRAEDGTPAETDALSQRIEAARAKLESICRPALADPWWVTKLSSVGAWVRGQDPGR